MATYKFQVHISMSQDISQQKFNFSVNLEPSVISYDDTYLTWICIASIL